MRSSLLFPSFTLQAAAGVVNTISTSRVVQGCILHFRLTHAPFMTQAKGDRFKVFDALLGSGIFEFLEYKCPLSRSA